jgi:hypothetical protein
MLGIFGRKKIGEDQLSKIFINAMWKMSSEAFPEIADILNEDPEFVSSPNLNIEDHTRFFFIIISGNLKYLPHRLGGSHGRFIVMKIYNQLAEMFDTGSGSIEKHIKKLQSEMSHLNHPSKNTLYAMSKLFFQQYDLYQFQEAYYRDIQAPNPVVLKRLDAIMESFLWDWEAFSDEYRIID